MKKLLYFAGLLISLSGCSKDLEGIPDNPFTNPDPSSSGEVPELEIKNSLSEIFTQEIYDYYDNNIVPDEMGYDEIVYIDPDYNGDSDGTLENPFRYLHEAPQKSNTAYLLKRGTSYVKHGGHYRFKVDNILIGAYGEGKRPEIKAEDKGGIIFSGDNCFVRDIVVPYVQYGLWGDEAVGGILFNVKMRSSWIWARNIRFIGCEVQGAGNNGIFVQQRDFSEDNFIEIGYCHIHEVNQDWTPTTDQRVAHGDGILISSFRGEYHIHNSIVDKSDVGNKFTIIVNAHKNEVNSVNGIIEDCYLYGPMPQPDGGSILYFGNVHGGNQDNYHFIIVRNNVMIGSSYDGEKYTGAAIFSHTSKFEVYGNYIGKCVNPLMLGNEKYGENKVFDNTIVPLEIP